MATKDKPARKGDTIFLTPDMFLQRNDPYFKTNGFFERSIASRVEEFSNLVEVWSTKESRDAKDDARPSSRGIDSFQNVHAQGCFWIASLLLDNERSGVTLPAKYLKTLAQQRERLPEFRTSATGCVDSAGFSEKIDRIVFALDTKF